MLCLTSSRPLRLLKVSQDLRLTGNIVDIIEVLGFDSERLLVSPVVKLPTLASCTLWHCLFVLIVSRPIEVVWKL